MERTAQNSTSPASEPSTDFATTWIPLDSLTEQWARVGAEATETPELSATK